MALKMAASAVLWWRRLFEAFPRPGLAVLIGRFSERFSRGQERGKRSSWLLLAPLLTQSVPQVTVQKSPPCCLCPEGTHRFQWIGNLVPEFGISSSQVQVLSSPMEFYDVMKAQIKLAKRRVILASLYLGTGPMEQALVDSMQETLESSQSSSLRVSVLLDFTRGSRGKNNSRTMLLPLLQKFPGQVQVSLFHTPNLRGLLRCLLPERFNETIGLQHIKVYVFDENVLLSGANLSDSYFTNRQDRYVLLQGCLEVADFFTELVEAIGDVSLQLQPDDTVFVKEGMLHPYQGLWLYQTGSSLPCLTLIGSPNFGYRSVHRDLEAQTALVTTNQELQEQLHQEQNMLYSLSNTVLSSTFEQPDRYVKLWVKLLTPLIKNFF